MVGIKRKKKKEGHPEIGQPIMSYGILLWKGSLLSSPAAC